MKVRVLYLARLREALGAAGEEVTLESGAGTVGDLLALLRARGGAWREELAGRRIVRCAVNHELAGADAVLADGDEVALFPPVTGG
jgi:molybdopterin synthase sulfur carrier subunit